MITPKPGYMVDPNNPNGVIPIAGYQAPSPAPNITSGGLPELGTNEDRMVFDPLTGAIPQITPPSNPSPAPVGNEQPGQRGDSVKNLQNWLINNGYSSYFQDTGATGYYGKQTTAAVTALQEKLGIDLGKYAGYYGPKTQSALASKYKTALDQANSGGEEPPATNPYTSGVPATTTAQTPQSTGDPTFDALTAGFAPILNQMTQVLSNINNPALTGASLQQQYADHAKELGIPQMQAELLNWQNIMNGTPDDIRNEITKAGGFATDSQVLAMSAARNNTILKQYNSVASVYQALTGNLNAMMGYASQDQNVALQKQQMSANIVQSIASLEGNMLNMGMTMQQNANGNLNKVVQNIGYTGLAQQAQGDPQKLSYYERILGLAPGSLSDPTTLQNMETYRQQMLKIGQQRVNVYAYNAGLGTGGGTATSPLSGNPFTPPPTQAQNTETGTYTVQAGDGLRAIAARYGITSDTGVQAVANLNGIKDINKITPGEVLKIPLAVTDPKGNPGYVDPTNYDTTQYTPIVAHPTVTQTSADKSYQYWLGKVQAAQQTPVGGSPLNKGRYTRNANSALKNYIASPVYQAVSSGAIYLARIKAAMSNPGSISDTSLADSIIKIETGGGQVTEAQLNTYFQGQSFADSFAIQGDKIVAKGGVLSPQQRSDLAGLAKETFDNYQQDYEVLYSQAMANLQGQGIPLNYGGNLPDFSSLIGTK